MDVNKKTEYRTARIRRALWLNFEAKDEFFEIAKWPAWARESFFKMHKDRKERFMLFIFFWKNGMDADNAIKWVLWHGGYDDSAIRSMGDLKKNTLTVAGRQYLNQFRVLDMAANIVC